jgi:molybdopterin molybdotransferase
MLSAVEALAHLLKNASPVNEEETVPTQAALGRVLAKDIASQVDVPPLDNTSMDGYAVRSSEIKQVGTVLRMAQRIPAGSVGQSLETGTIARIFTGAPIPQGADAVVMQEDCIVQDQNELVQINSVPNAGQWIRRRGEDLTAGKLALTAGSLLRPQQLGVAASAGYAQLPVKRKVRVAAFFTGDELSLPGEPLKPGGIYNSNRDTLLGVIRSLGCEATDYGIVPDRLEATRAALRTASANHDLIITSGGVSVGEEDHIKPAVNAEGRLDLWQIAIKPGKPLAFGSDLSSPSYLMRADFDWLKPDRRNEFLRVKINAQGGLDLFPNQSSGVLTSAAWGDGLLDCPAGQGFKKGDMVRYIPFSGLLS